MKFSQDFRMSKPKRSKRHYLCIIPQSHSSLLRKALGMWCCKFTIFHYNIYKMTRKTDWKRITGRLHQAHTYPPSKFRIARQVNYHSARYFSFLLSPFSFNFRTFVAIKEYNHIFLMWRFGILGVKRMTNKNNEIIIYQSEDGLVAPRSGVWKICTYHLAWC